MFSPLGRIKEALADIKVALDLRPSAQLFVMSGTLLFMQEVGNILTILVEVPGQNLSVTAAQLAQLVEGRTTVREVSGSSPRPDQHSGS